MGYNIINISIMYCQGHIPSVYDTMFGDAPSNQANKVKFQSSIGKENLFRSYHQRRSRKKGGVKERGEKRRRGKKSRDCSDSSECNAGVLIFNHNLINKNIIINKVLQ